MVRWCGLVSLTPSGIDTTTNEEKNELHNELRIQQIEIREYISLSVPCEVFEVRSLHSLSSTFVVVLPTTTRISHKQGFERTTGMKNTQEQKSESQIGTDYADYTDKERSLPKNLRNQRNLC